LIILNNPKVAATIKEWLEQIIRSWLQCLQR
jgi:hypothetical protein